jgi:hypothetical protein
MHKNDEYGGSKGISVGEGFELIFTACADKKFTSYPYDNK